MKSFSEIIIQQRNRERYYLWLHFWASMLILIFLVYSTWFSLFLFIALFVLFVTNLGLALKALEQGRKLDMVILKNTIKGLQDAKKKA